MNSVGVIRQNLGLSLLVHGAALLLLLSWSQSQKKAPLPRFIEMELLETQKLPAPPVTLPASEGGIPARQSSKGVAKASTGLTNLLRAASGGIAAKAQVTGAKKGKGSGVSGTEQLNRLRQELLSQGSLTKAPPSEELERLQQASAQLRREDLLQELPLPDQKKAALRLPPDEKREAINRVFSQNEAAFRDCAEKAKLLDPGFKAVSDAIFALSASGRISSHTIKIEGIGSEESKTFLRSCTSRVLSSLRFPENATHYVYHRAWKI